MGVVLRLSVPDHMVLKLSISSSASPCQQRYDWTSGTLTIWFENRVYVPRLAFVTVVYLGIKTYDHSETRKCKGMPAAAVVRMD